MNQDVIYTLNKLNEQFYRDNCESFDRSRQTAWPGWESVADFARGAARDGSLSIADMACGNLRFERFLAESLPDFDLRATCVDSCDELVVALDFCEYRSLDIISALVESGKLPALSSRPFDIAVSFGFLHHIPSRELRELMVDSLVDAVRPKGLVAVSLWRFADYDKGREKARRTTDQALASLQLPDALEEGDYLLGWNELAGTYRYCHSFGNDEISDIIEHAAPRATLVDRFRADGKTGNSNEYLIFSRCC